MKRWPTGIVGCLAIGCLVVTTLTANAARARAESVTFDFSSGPGPNFAVLNDGGLWTVNTAGPDLRISKPADDGTFRPTGFISGGISSGFVLNGDFAVTVDFTLYNFPGAGGWERLNESILNVTHSAAAYFEVLRFRNNNQDSVEGWSVPTGGTFGLDTTVTSGRYRISRTGWTMTAAYAPEGSSSFIDLGGSNNAAWQQPMQVELLGTQGLSNINATRSTTAMDIGFDNLVVQADSISGLVPEPSTFVLLGMGAVGLLAYAWRRRKRAV